VPLYACNLFAHPGFPVFIKKFFPVNFAALDTGHGGLFAVEMRLPVVDTQSAEIFDFDFARRNALAKGKQNRI
jgi:hypothetical protein